MEQPYAADGSAKMEEPFWKLAVSTKANHVPLRLGLCVAGIGTELDKNMGRTRDLG